MVYEAPEEKAEIQKVRYASAVGSLMYAKLFASPEIFYVVGIMSRFQSNLVQVH